MAETTTTVGGEAWGKDTLMCSLCHEYYKDPRILPCNHTFCRKCLQGTYDRNQSISPTTKLTSMACPSCEQTINIPQIGVSGFPLDLNIRKKKEEFMNKLLDNVGNNKNDTTKTYSFSPGSHRRLDTKSPDDSPLGRHVNTTRGGHHHSTATHATSPGDGMDFRRSQPPPFSPGTFRRNQMVDGLIRSRRERSPHVSTHTAPSAVPFFASPTSDPTSPEEGGKTFRPFSGSRPSRLTQRRRLHEGSRYKSDPGLQGLVSGQTSEFSPPPEDRSLRSPEPLRRDDFGSSITEADERSPSGLLGTSESIGSDVPLSGIYGDRRSRSRRHVRFVSDENMPDSVEKSSADQAHDTEKAAPAIRPSRISGLTAASTTRPDQRNEHSKKVTEPVSERLKATSLKDSTTKNLGSNKTDKSSSPPNHSARRRFFNSLSSPESKVTSPTGARVTSPTGPKVTSPTGAKPSEGLSPNLPSPDQGPPSPGSKSPSGRVKKRPSIPSSLKPDQSPPSPDRQKFATTSSSPDRPKSGSSPNRPRTGSTSTSPNRKFVFPTTNSLPRNHRSSSFSHLDKQGTTPLDSAEDNKKPEVREQSPPGKDTVKDKTFNVATDTVPISRERTSQLTANKPTSEPSDKRSAHRSRTVINKDKVNIQQVRSPLGKADTDKHDKPERNAENDEGGLQNRRFVVDHVDMLNVVIGGSHPNSSSGPKDDILKSSSAQQEQTDTSKSSVNTKARHNHSTKPNLERSTNHTPNSPQLPKTSSHIKSEPVSGSAVSPSSDHKPPVSRTGANNAHNRTDYGTKLRESRGSEGSSEGYKARYISSSDSKVTAGGDRSKLSDKSRVNDDSKGHNKNEESFVQVEEITVHSDTIHDPNNSCTADKPLKESGGDIKTHNNNYQPVGKGRSLSASPSKPQSKPEQEKSSEDQMKFMREVEEVISGDDVIQQQQQEECNANVTSGCTVQESSSNGEHPSSNSATHRATDNDTSGVTGDSKPSVTATRSEVHEDKRNGHAHSDMVGSESRTVEEVNSGVPDGINHVDNDKANAETISEDITPDDNAPLTNKKRSIPVQKAPKQTSSSTDDMTKLPKEPETNTPSSTRPPPESSQEAEPEVEAQREEEEEEMTPENPIYTSDSIWQMEKKDYEMPTSVVVLSNGNTVVAEFNTGVIQYFDESGKFLYDTGGVKPFCIATNEADHVIVADRKTKSIRIFDEYGSDVTQWKSDCFKWISGVACTSNGRFVIYDRDNYKVGTYSQSGEKVSEFGSYGQRDTQLCMADFLAVDSQDRIILCDSGNHCIKVFDGQGGFIRKFGTRGHGNGQMEWPKGICCDSKDNIIVADNRNNRVSLYSSDGEFIQHLIREFPNPFGVFLSKSNLLGVTHYSLGGASQLAVFKINEIAGDT